MVTVPWIRSSRTFGAGYVRKLGRGTVLVALLFLTPLPRSLQHSQAQSIIEGPTWQHTWALTQKFIAAYDAGDLRDAMAVVDQTHLYYADCDYVWRKSNYITSPQQLRSWLRVRFEEHDRFADIQLNDPAATPPGATGATVYGARASDILTAADLSPLPVAAKILPDNSGDQLGALIFSSATDCERSRLPSAASSGQTSVLIRAFVDAYNGADLRRATGLLASHLSYVDCAYVRGGTRSFATKTALSSWLKSRFAAHDTLADTRTTGVSGAHPRLVRVAVVRSSDILAHLGVSSLATNLRGTSTPLGRRLASVAFSCPAPANSRGVWRRPS